MSSWTFGLQPGDKVKVFGPFGEFFAKETVKFLKEEGLISNSFILITSAIHMHRAEACFKKEGLDCATFSTDHYYDPSSSLSLNSFVPSAEGFIMWKRMIKEWVGTVMYRLFGYL